LQPQRQRASHPEQAGHATPVAAFPARTPDPRRVVAEDWQPTCAASDMSTGPPSAEAKLPDRLPGSATISFRWPGTAARPAEEGQSQTAVGGSGSRPQGLGERFGAGGRRGLADDRRPSKRTARGAIPWPAPAWSMRCRSRRAAMSPISLSGSSCVVSGGPAMRNHCGLRKNAHCQWVEKPKAGTRESAVFIVRCPAQGGRLPRQLCLPGPPECNSGLPCATSERPLGPDRPGQPPGHNARSRQRIIEVKGAAPGTTGRT
jgi:hypothetical protein